jgi:hypothetical protein
MPANQAAIAAWGNLLTTTNELRQGETQNTWMNDHPLLFFMDAMGGVQMYDGGTSIIIELNTIRDTSVATRGISDSIPLVNVEHLRPAEFTATVIDGAAAVNLFETEGDNSGAQKVLDLYDERLKNVMDTMKDELNLQILQGLGSGNDLGGLPLLISATPTTGTVGGINRATATWWRNQVQASVGSFATNGLAFLRSISGAVDTSSRVNRSTLHITTQTAYDAYELTQSGVVRYAGPLSGKMADAGFEANEWRRAPVMWDNDVIAGDWNVINFDNLFLKVNSAFNFRVAPPIQSEGQWAQSSKVAWYGQLCTNNPRFLGKGTGITA